MSLKTTYPGIIYRLVPLDYLPYALLERLLIDVLLNLLDDPCIFIFQVFCNLRYCLT